jgi:hypothetical protein
MIPLRDMEIRACKISRDAFLTPLHPSYIIPNFSKLRLTRRRKIVFSKLVIGTSIATAGK